MREVKTVAQLAQKLQTGKTPPSKQKEYFDGKLNWYTPTDLDNGKYLSLSARTLTMLAKDDKKINLVPPGSLLIGCIGNVGKLGITTEESCSNQQITAVVPKKSVDVNYLYYWFQANQKEVAAYANNAVVPILNNRTLGTIKVPIFPLPTQRRIAAALDLADRHRQLLRKEIAAYGQLGESLFLDMFGDPARNDQRWTSKPIGKIANVSSGSTPSRKVAAYYGGEIPWVKTGEVKGLVIRSAEEHITKEGLKNSSCRLYPKGSILVAMYGQGKTRGSVGMLNFEAATNQACAVIEPANEYNSIFLFEQLKYSYNSLRSLGRGGNQANLNGKMVKDYKVILPPIVVQNDFAYRIQKTEILKAKAEAALAEADDLFNALLQRAFRGELFAEKVKAEA